MRIYRVCKNCRKYFLHLNKIYNTPSYPNCLQEKEICEIQIPNFVPSHCH